MMKQMMILAALAAGLALTLGAAAMDDSAPTDASALSFGDMHKMAERSYRLTKIQDEARSQSLSAKDFVILGRRGIIEYFLVSRHDAATSILDSRIVVQTTGSEAVEEETTLLPASRRRTAGARMHQWNGYTAVYHRKGQPVELAEATLEGRTDKARLGAVEELEIPVATADLFAPVRVGSGINLTLHSKISKDIQLEIPFAYLVGYFAKAAEEGYLSEEDKLLVERLRAALHSKAGT